LATRRRVVLGAFFTTSILGAAVAAPTAVLAATITVNTLADSNTANDGACSLREAITAANLNAANTNNDCTDGTSGGFDDITRSVDGTITLGSDLPAITDGIAIDGNYSLVIDGGGSARPFTVVSGGLTLYRLTIQNGFVGGTFGFGGAISNGSTVALEHVTIRSSKATSGGAIHNNGAMAINNSTIEGNTATEVGGAIFDETGGAVTLRNTTISGNKAAQGGGVYSLGATTIAHATIARNTANCGGGGGVYKGAGAITVTNSILVANTGGQTAGGLIEPVASVVRSSADGVIDTALRDNGGDIRTYRLPAGSPALSLGIQQWCGFVDNVDQRGLARPNAPTSKCDAGADQRDRVAPTMTVKPKIRLRENVSLSGTKLRATLLGWSATDGSGIGIERFSLQRQVNGGSWTSVSTSVQARPDVFAFPATGQYNVNLSKDKRYRFRIRAVDEDKNVSAWAYTPTVTARLFQQTNSRVAFSTGWTTASSTKFSGGSVKYTKTVGKSVRFTFTGRAFALVTTVRAQNLSLKAYTDGVAGLRELSSTQTAYQRQMFPQFFSGSERHVIRYVLNGSARFDVDAIAILE
jgi:CSLREA domain-containing protein